MTAPIERMLPLYQGMMTTFYDHRAADVIKSPTASKRQNQPRYLSDAEKADPLRSALPMYWVREELIPELDVDWLLAFSDVTSATNERSLVPSALPLVATNHKVPLIFTAKGPRTAACLLAMLSSFIVDYLVRQKLGGTSMTYFYVRQLAVLPPSRFEEPCPWDNGLSLREWIAIRVRNLVHTSHDMDPFARSMSHHGAPTVWDPEQRIRERAELEAAFFNLYEVSRDNVSYVLETFPITRRHDEACYGEFRTRRLILEAYDRLAHAPNAAT